MVLSVGENEMVQTLATGLCSCLLFPVSISCNLKDVSKGKANSGNLKCHAVHMEEIPTYS